MSDRVREATQELQGVPLDPGEIAQSGAFLAWLLDGNFTFLGYREQALVKEGGEELLQIVQGSGLGILRERESRRLARSFIAHAIEERRLQLRLYRPMKSSHGTLGFKLYQVEFPFRCPPLSPCWKTWA